MGFFSDLKEDLSQAVNELMPEEEATATETIAEETADVDLSDLLDKVEAMNEGEAESTETPADIPVEPAYTAPVYQESAYTAPVYQEPAKSVAPARAVMTDENSMITPGMVIRGDITTQGSLEMTGTVIGNIEALGKLSITGTVQGDSKAYEIYAEGARITGNLACDGSIKIGQSTVIIGGVSATSAVIAGAVKGDIDVKGPVILDGSAIVMGNIKSKSVQINNGAVIEGMCSQCYADVNPTSFFEDLKKR